MKLQFLLVAVMLSAGATFSTQVYAKETRPKATQFDAKFLDQMTDHHKDAIKMGELAESKAQNPELKKMAEKMIADQKEEIDQMKNWRGQFYASAPVAKPMQPKMDMSALKNKSGRDFDMAFIDMMRMHHEQGIDMAKSASDKLFNAQVKTFAQNVVMKQSHERDELEQMKKMEASQSGTTQK